MPPRHTKKGGQSRVGGRPYVLLQRLRNAAEKCCHARGSGGLVEFFWEHSCLFLLSPKNGLEGTSDAKIERVLFTLFVFSRAVPFQCRLGFVSAVATLETAKVPGDTDGDGGDGNDGPNVGLEKGRYIERLVDSKYQFAFLFRDVKPVRRCVRAKRGGRESVVAGFVVADEELVHRIDVTTNPFQDAGSKCLFFRARLGFGWVDMQTSKMAPNSTRLRKVL